MAETPSGPVFVAGALPGETVTIRSDPRHANRAQLVEILEASPDRLAPPCPHFLTECGACAVQHFAAAPTAAWKTARLAEALSRAGFPAAPLGAMQAAPPGTRRRADLALRRGTQGVAIGFHARGSAAVADLTTCHVLDPALVALFRPLREMLRRLNALKRDGSAVLNLLETGPDLLLRTDGPLDPPGRALLASFATAHGLPRIAWALREGTPETAAQTGPVRLTLSGVAVAPPPGAFLQAAPAGEAAIIAAVLAGLPKLPARARIGDLYAGIGTISFALAPHGRITAFEGDAAAVTALDAAARAVGGGVSAVRRDLAYQPLLGKEIAGFDLLVLDPPFAGAAEQVAQIARSALRHVIYVSCNPVALGRDLGLLRQAGFAVRAATPIDQFPWSVHLESVVVLERVVTK